MVIKTCKKCRVDKSVEDFGFRTKEHTTRFTACRECRNKAKLEWLEPTKIPWVRKGTTRANRDSYLGRKEKVKQFIREYKEGHPCVDCGETDHQKLEFDHLDPKEKSFSVGEKARHGPIPLVQKEIAKCEVRCGNCHALRHYVERSGWRHRFHLTGETKTQKQNIVASYLMSMSCAHCGNTDMRVLEFDHIDRGKKKANIAKLMGSGPVVDLLDEIAKCQVLCRNCHRVKTYAEPHPKEIAAKVLEAQRKIEWEALVAALPKNRPAENCY